MSNLSFCGIDLAKNHFSVHAINQHGKVILHKNVTRSKLLNTIAKLPPMRIGIEACGGAHYWAITFNQLGHDCRIMAAKYVAPYRMKGKTTSMMPLLYAKRFNDHLLDLFLLNLLSNKPFLLLIECANIGFAKERR